MDLKILENFLNGNVSANTLVGSISSEVQNYRQNSMKRKSSLPIYVTNDEFVRSLKPSDVRKILDGYFSGVFSEWDVNYIFNAIELSSSFEIIDEIVEDVVFQIANPEINEPLTHHLFRQMYESLEK